MNTYPKSQALSLGGIMKSEVGLECPDKCEDEM